MTRFHRLLMPLTLLILPSLAGAMAGNDPQPLAPDSPVPLQPVKSALVRVTGGGMTPVGIVQRGQLLRAVTPLYPPGARHAQVAGMVRVEMWVGKDGRVVGAEVLSGPPLLRRAALEAAKRWRYEPSHLDGKPIDRIVRINFDFAADTY